jgi:hypothetical protein
MAPLCYSLHAKSKGGNVRFHSIRRTRSEAQISRFGGWKVDLAEPKGSGEVASIPDLPRSQPEQAGSTRSGHLPVLLDHLVSAGEDR